MIWLHANGMSIFAGLLVMLVSSVAAVVVVLSVSEVSSVAATTTSLHLRWRFCKGKRQGVGFERAKWNCSNAESCFDKNTTALLSESK